MEISAQMLLNIFIYSLLYISTAVFIIGMWHQIRDIAKTPNPLVIPQTPQAADMCGVVRRMAGDLFLFKSLLKGSRSLWTAGIIFHFSFAILMGFHLFGLVSYIVEKASDIHISTETMGLLSNIATFTGVLFITSLIALMIIRTYDEKSTYYSRFVDYFVILLIFLIGITGIFMKINSFGPDLPKVKDFMINIFSIHPKSIPMNLFFITHLTLVSILLLVFPFTKMIHAVGFFFSPTRNMPNNPRAVRHINVWD